MDINKALKSRIHRKIIAFFHENQASIDTPRGVATWIEEDRTKVKKALEELIKIDIITADRATSTTGYSYTRNAAIISKIDKLLKE